MILVTTGTNGTPFDRLLRELDDLAPGEEVVVQHGPSSVRPREAKCVSYLPFEEMMRLIAEARVVVTHGGAGTVLATLREGHRPLVVPRRLVHGEAVDDHQFVFAQRLDRDGLVRLVEDFRELRRLAYVGAKSARPEAHRAARLQDELAAYLRSDCGCPSV